MTELQMHGLYLWAIGKLMFEKKKPAHIIADSEYYNSMVVDHMVAMGADADAALLFVLGNDPGMSVNAQA
jgi:hypothetical protein